MAIPTVLVNLKVRRPTSAEAECVRQVDEEATSTLEMPGTRDVSFELSKQSIHTMLEGLGKIKDQLGQFA